jgi:hypothetical protein
MQLKTFALASLAGSFMVAGSASAAFMGLTTELVGGTELEGWVDDGYDASMLDTYRVYAQFDQAGVDVTAVGDAANDGITFSTTSTDGAFFNSSFGSDFAPNPSFIGVAPDLQWDTFVTIGENPAMGAGGVPVTGAAPGFSEQAAGLVGDFTLDDTGYFVAAFPDFAASDEEGLVLIAQFTVAEGVHVEGLNWRVSSVTDGVLADDFGDFNTIPAPGALALLGLAGIASRRRRR